MGEEAGTHMRADRQAPADGEPERWRHKPGGMRGGRTTGLTERTASWTDGSMDRYTDGQGRWMLTETNRWTERRTEGRTAGWP